MIAFTQKGYTEFPWIEDRRGQKELDVFLLSDNDHTNFSFNKEIYNEQFFDDFLNYSLAIFTFSVYTDTVIYFSE